MRWSYCGQTTRREARSRQNLNLSSIGITITTTIGTTTIIITIITGGIITIIIIITGGITTTTIIGITTTTIIIITTVTAIDLPHDSEPPRLTRGGHPHQGFFSALSLAAR